MIVTPRHQFANRRILSWTLFKSLRIGGRIQEGLDFVSESTGDDFDGCHAPPSKGFGGFIVLPLLHSVLKSGEWIEHKRSEIAGLAMMTDFQ